MRKTIYFFIVEKELFFQFFLNNTKFQNSTDLMLFKTYFQFQKKNSKNKHLKNKNKQQKI